MPTSSLRLDEELVSNAKVMGEVMSRSAAKQVEHWARIGRIMEENPDLTYEFVRDSMIAKAEADSGLVEEYQFG